MRARAIFRNCLVGCVSLNVITFEFEKCEEKVFSFDGREVNYECFENSLTKGDCYY